MKTSPGIAAKMFRVLADEGVNIEMISHVAPSASASSRRPPTWSRPPGALHTAFGLDSGQAYSAPLPERK